MFAFVYSLLFGHLCHGVHSDASIVFLEMAEDGSGVHTKILRRFSAVAVVSLQDLVDVPFLELVFGLVERRDRCLVTLG